MLNPRSPLLDTLRGKTVASARVSQGHGEVLEITFTDGTMVHVCSTYGVSDDRISADPHSIYVSIDEVTV